MSKTIQHRQILCLAAALIVALGLAALISAEPAQAASNKALKTTVIFTGVDQNALINGTLTEDQIQKAAEDNMYTLCTTCKKPLQLKKNMKLSGKVYIPKALLKNNGSMVNVLPILICTKGEKTHEIWGKIGLVLSNKAGAVKLNLYDITSSPVKKSGVAKLKKTKKYYVVQLNSYPLNNKTNDRTPVAVPTKGKYQTTITFSVAGWGTACEANLYVDDLKLVAKKTTKINFNKKNYRKIFGFRTESGMPIKVKAAPIK
ncbi:MAG: hypothetical protein IJI20_02425 [Firmicutes bacterium]|nr:hypothetical protein [Bacillota bacterium]